MFLGNEIDFYFILFLVSFSPQNAYNLDIEPSGGALY